MPSLHLLQKCELQHFHHTQASAQRANIALLIFRPLPAANSASGPGSDSLRAGRGEHHVAGLTSAGGALPDPSKGEKPLEKGAVVAVLAQGKELPFAIGLLQMSTDEIREKNKGIGIDNIHYLGGE